MKIIDRFAISYFQYLNDQSEISDVSILPDTETLLALYRLMVLVRVLDTKAIALQRTGKLGTYPSTRGQEAVFVGVGRALEKQDLFVPYYRDIGTLIQRGVKISQILLYWGGDERGNCFTPESEDFPFSVPVGSQGLHAAGAAFAIKYHQQKRAVLTLCGDGATSQGDFYEALNVAGIWKLPVVFVVCNNQWAISVPRSAQTAAHTLAQKAIAAGIPGEQIDGNDVIAVWERTQAALLKAREESEPCLLEMICYRQHDHTTADDASRYEPKQRREEEWIKEPIMRLRHYLEKNHLWAEQDEIALQETCMQEVNQAVQEYLNTPSQSLTSLFDYLYEQLPACYWPQRDQVEAIGEQIHG